MPEIGTARDLAKGARWLVAREPRFQVLRDRYGLPPLRRMPQGLETLLRIVTDQLISLAAADAIWRRVAGQHGNLTAGAILRTGEDGLRALGLSGAKARCFLAICEADLSGHFDSNALRRLADDQLRLHLCQVKGIGPWTAEIYMLSALGRSDAWPAGDVALQAAVGDLLDLGHRPDQKAMAQIAEPWRPFRSVAARILWCHYRHLKGLPRGE